MSKYLYIFLISMVPLIELRGAIPVAAILGLPISISYIVAVLGNLVPLPFIYFFAQKVLVWGSNKKIIGNFFSFILQKGEKAGNKLQKNGSTMGVMIVALILFVGIPLPGTGGWTGCLAASILRIPFYLTMIALTAGVILAGVIMSSGVLAIIGLI